jgi:4a-hydroxytetrahydrobiopterin dehydratase
MRNERRLATREEIDAHLAAHTDWQLRDGKLHREYAFPSFVVAFGFMASCALIAERMNHHPEWSNVYSRVVVDLQTHDLGGISPDDIALADAMDGLAALEAGMKRP